MATDLQEALSSVGAAPLIQKRIDPVLVELMRRFAPLLRALPTVSWDSNVYYFNQRTVLPAGGFVADGGSPRPVTTSTYVQNSFPIKLLQVVGAVTGFAQAVTQDLIGNLRAVEMEGASRGLMWDTEIGVVWGNAAATQFGPYPQMDGLDTQLATFSGSSQNAFNLANANFDLGTLDTLIDLVTQNVAEDVQNSNWMFICSPTVQSRISQLLVNQQRFNNVVEIEPGLVLNSYRNVPIVNSSFLAPRGQVMGTVTSSTSTTTGTLANATYYYRVSAVLNRFGESQASAEISQVTTGSNTSVNTLSFTPPTGPNGAAANLYKVFRSTSAGAESLLGVVDANVSTSADGSTVLVANQIVDNGTTLIPQNSTGPTQPANVNAAYVSTNSNLLPLNSGEQNIYLISRDPNNIVRPYVRNFQPIELYPTTSAPDSLPFAMVADTTLAIRSNIFIARAANVNVTLAS